MNAQRHDEESSLERALIEAQREERESSTDFAEVIDANIGRNLKAARERLGYSQSEVARRVSDLGLRGFHQTTIARIENNQRSLRAAEALALVRVLEASIETLAESEETVALRLHLDHLNQRRSAFESAARELMHARRIAAGHLDEAFPYGVEAHADEADVAASTDPWLYGVLENVLASTAPHELLTNVYLDEFGRASANGMYSRRPGAAFPGRLELILEDATGRIDTGHGEHQAKA